MPGSGEFYGEDSNATKDAYINEAGKRVVRGTITVPERGQLSGEAFGDSLDKSFEQPESSPAQESHDFGPDN